jgi:Glycosyltransferase
LKPSSKHIVFVATRLDLPGGIEKAIVSTANLLVGKGYEITLLIADVTTNRFYAIDERVKVAQLSLSFGIEQKGSTLTRKVTMVKDVLAFRKWFKNVKADVIIATEYHLSVVCVLAGVHNKYKLMSWEHHHRYSLKKNTFWRKLIEFSYPKLSTIICLNDEEKELFTDLNSNVVTIPNFTPIQDAIASVKNGHSKKILTVAYLSYTKGIDLLLEVAKNVLKTNDKVVWKVIGNGEELAKTVIHKFISDENLQGRIIIQEPTSSDLSEEYRSADIFVLTSRFECFPMTLLEAMSYSVPCIAFDCDTGPRHIIRNQVNGFLATNGNTNEMSKLIIELLSNEDYRKEIAKQAQIDSLSFSPEHVYLLWDRLLSQ